MGGMKARFEKRARCKSVKRRRSRQFKSDKAARLLFRLDVNREVWVLGLKMLDQSRYCQRQARMIELLLEKGASIDGKDRAGRIALMAGVWRYRGTGETGDVGDTGGTGEPGDLRATL